VFCYTTVNRASENVYGEGFEGKAGEIEADAFLLSVTIPEIYALTNER
jgi:hypothetical protein